MLISRRKKWALIFLYGSVQAVIIWDKTATKTFEIFLIKSKNLPENSFSVHISVVSYSYSKGNDVKIPPKYLHPGAWQSS